MTFNIITNINNGAGLQRDYELLRCELELCGHTVHGVQYDAEFCPINHADVNVFLEVINPALFQYAEAQWMIPNPEWWFERCTDYLPTFSKVLCKTHDCLRLFAPLVGNRARYVGFVARDLYRPSVPREYRFLHVAGNSMIKNTEAVLHAWAALPYELTVVTRFPENFPQANDLPNVTVASNLTDEALTVLANRCMFHLCPSKYEGFGHYLHEALSVGALVITLDAPPMNEISCGVLMPTFTEGSLRLATLHGVLARDIEQAVRTVTTPVDTVEIRRTYLAGNEEFRANLRAILGEI